MVGCVSRQWTIGRKEFIVTSMKKIIVLKLVRVEYTGKSIGNDIRLEVDIFDRTIRFDSKVKRGDSIRPDLELGRIKIDGKSIVIPITIRVIERDLLFNDTGFVKAKIKITHDGTFPQRFVHAVEVRESRGFLTKSKAQFEILIEASSASKEHSTSYKGRSIKWWKEWKELKTYAYRGVNGKEDYNRYDTLITKAVAEWNKKFCDEKLPPPEPLDSNLVKAMAYVESRMGYFHSGGYPGFPDIMQIADSRNPAIHTLNNDGWKNRKGDVAHEYEWRKGRIIDLDYDGEANGSTPQESVRWGVRWLYHCAQGISNKNTRYWRPWREAVRTYNGGGNKRYEDEVYNIYLQGIDKRKKPYIKLYSFIFFAFFSISLAGVFFSVFASQEDLLQPVIESVSREDIDDIEQSVRSEMDALMAVYKEQGRYYYGDLFLEPIQTCARYGNECFSDLIFPSYLDDLLINARTMRAFLEAARSLEIVRIDNSFSDDLDNDGDAEVAIVLEDYLNREYLDVAVVDFFGQRLRMVRKRLFRPYTDLPPRAVDVTGDAVPEILVFASGGRQDLQAYIFQYKDGEIHQIFSLDRDYLRADITVADTNGNQIPDITVTGEQYGDECMACEHKRIREVFEYNEKTRTFDLLRSQEF